MLFKQLIAFSAIVFVLAGCSDQPMQEGGTTPPSKGDNTNGVNNSTPDGGDNDSADSGSQPPSLTDPTSGNDNAPITPPAVSSLSRKSLTISGSVSGSQPEDTYAFQVCAGQECDSWQQVMSEGMYQRKFHLSQWSTNIPLTIEGNKKENPASQPAEAIDALSSSYFKTEVAPFEQLIKRDSNNDGMIDEKELATLSLNPVNMAFHAVAKHLLSTKLSNVNNLPYEAKYQAVRQYLSNNSKKAQLKLSQSQIQEITAHINSQDKKIFGEYSLQLTPEQWADLDGPLNTNNDQKFVNINAAQLKEIHHNHRYSKPQSPLTLSVSQTNAIHHEQIYTQQLVLELAALYQILLKPKMTDFVISKYDKAALIEKIESKTVTQNYSIPIDSKELIKMGMFDIPIGIEANMEISSDKMNRAYQQYQKTVEENGFADFTIAISHALWSKSNKTFAQIGDKLLNAADSNSSLELWEHYQNEFAATHYSVPVYQELSKALSPNTQKSYLHQNHIQNLQDANHVHPLKPAILALAPERYLKISGRFPKELEQASMSIVLGSRPKPTWEELGTSPDRHLPIDLIDSENQRHKKLNLSGENRFVTTIVLRDIDNLYAHCQPGLLGKNHHTSDEMQDTLTIHVRDEKTGVELRSVLGSFCDIAQLDQLQGNKNGVLSYEEFERLNVGYISTAQAALLFKSSLSSWGGPSSIIPLTHQSIIDKYNQLPRKQVELLAAFIALQAKGSLFNATVDVGELGSLYEDLLTLIDITLGGYRLSPDNSIPSIEDLQNKFANRYAINQVLIANPDVNISHIIQAITQRLGDSEVDQYYFPTGIRPGSWVTVYPVSAIDVTCQQTMQDSQLVGIRIEGKGQDETGHWVTIGWDEQAGASSYTLGWGKNRFEQLIEAQNVLAINEYGSMRATISGLDSTKEYYIRVQSNTGSPSALLSYSPSNIHIADSRVIQGLAGDDSTRGRDSSSTCDPLTGKAENSNDDGVLGARYLKLDSTGKPLPRQDLNHSILPFACVLDAHTGLVWETKHQRGDDEDPTIYDSDNRFVIQPANGATQFGGTCTKHETNEISTDPNQCTVTKQVQTFNSVERCGLNNWRMPTLHEAIALVDFNAESSGIDHHYFPYIQAMWLDTPSLDATTYLSLSLQNQNTLRNDIHHYQPLMLVSDGFHVEQQ